MSYFTKYFKDVEGFDHRYIDIVKPYLEDLDKSCSSSDQQVAAAGRGGGSGFYRVPDDMRRRAASEEGDLYEPKYVNFSKIKDLFQEKDNLGRQQLRHYCYHFRSYADRNRKKIGSFMWELFEKLREEEQSSITPDFFALLFGYCYLNDLFQRSFWNDLSTLEDPECARLWVSELWADLLLLQNQIPNSLQSHYEIYSFFYDFLPLNEETVYRVLRHSRKKDSSAPLNILHYIHDILLPDETNEGLSPFDFLCCLGKEMTIMTSSEPPSTMKPVPTATRLQQAGIKFKPVDDEGLVEFKRGVLRLPRLHITKGTKKVLMNLIAWEKCHLEAPNYIINFAIFMDYLINTSKDVEILVQNRVFEHSLATDEEVAALFNGVNQDLVYVKDHRDYDIFPKLSEDINNYCRSRPKLWWANLMQDHFKSPWTIISLVGALLLIMLTMVQTFFSAYSYFRPPH